MTMVIHKWRIPSQTTGKMRKNFDFVNVTTPSEQADPAYRRQVHVQAMRSFRRKQRLENVERYRRENSQGTIPDEEAAEPSPFGSPRTISARSKSKSPRLDQSAYITIATTDPFQALPAGFEQYQDLLRYFQNHIGPMLLPETSSRTSTSSWSTQWLQTAISSPLLLAATCSHASFFLDDIQGHTRSSKSLQLQSTTIRSLNKALESGVSDEAVGAVLMLVANTLISDDAEQMDVHMRALGKMVTLRGGRDTVGSGSPIKMGILWHLGASYAFDGGSFYPEILDVERISVQAFPGILARLRELTERRYGLETFSRDGDLVAFQGFSDDRSLLESQLGLLRRDLQHDTSGRTQLICRAMCLGALFYCFFYLRRFLMGGVFTDRMIGELVQVLSLLDDQIEWLESEAVEKVLWASTIAARFSQTQEQVRFARGFAVKLAGFLGLEGLAMWKECLGRVVWPGKVWESTLLDLAGGMARGDLSDEG